MPALRSDVRFQRPQTDAFYEPTPVTPTIMADHDGIVRVGRRNARDADNNGEPDGVDVRECVSIIFLIIFILWPDSKT